jgi:hypothetical protein
MKMSSLQAPYRDPGLDPASMNIRLVEFAWTMFMDPDFRQDGAVEVRG